MIWVVGGFDFCAGVVTGLYFTGMLAEIRLLQHDDWWLL